MCLPGWPSISRVTHYPWRCCRVLVYSNKNDHYWESRALPINKVRYYPNLAHVRTVCGTISAILNEGEWLLFSEML